MLILDLKTKEMKILVDAYFCSFSSWKLDDYSWCGNPAFLRRENTNAGLLHIVFIMCRHIHMYNQTMIQATN